MRPFPDKLVFVADSLLISLYRIIPDPLPAYLLGTFLLCFLCVIAGELTVSVALRFNRRYFNEMTEEMIRKEKLSMAAYEAGDKESYRALNKEATDVWGKRFFTMVAYSAGILWPIPFALAWMQTRFHGIAFPLAWPLSIAFGETVGYTFTFIPLYILCRIVFKYMRPHLPYFRGVQKLLDAI
ncbi:MAG: hypothetical protein B5M55_01170 [Desulfococcus sp. 4484_242]|nr:MAG: hypothetical protein B5M55_01170 [Desulfococcus sp. 4484_242]